MERDEKKIVSSSPLPTFATIPSNSSYCLISAPATLSTEDTQHSLFTTSHSSKVFFILSLFLYDESNNEFFQHLGERASPLSVMKSDSGLMESRCVASSSFHSFYHSATHVCGFYHPYLFIISRLRCAM